MDVLTEYLKSAVHHYRHEFLPYLPAITEYLPTLFSFSSAFGQLMSNTTSTLRPMVEDGLSLQQTVFLLALLFLSLQLLGMLKRYVYSWVVFFFWLALWGSVALMALWVYTRGPQATWSRVSAWGVDLGRVWLQEKDRWDAAARHARQAGSKKARDGRWS